MTVLEVIKQCYPINCVQIFPKNKEPIRYSIKEVIDGARSESNEIMKNLNLEVYGYVDDVGEVGESMVKVFTF